MEETTKLRIPMNTVLDLDAVSAEGRDISIFRAACKLWKACVPVETALRLAMRAANSCTPPFPVDDAMDAVARAYARLPDGVGERFIMQEEDRMKPDPTLRALVGDGTHQRRDFVEIGGDVLVQAYRRTGEHAPPSLPLLGQKGYVIEGWSHLLAGYPRCGKSELLVRLCREWLAAGKRVVYFTEEPRSIWEHRLGAVAGGGPLTVDGGPLLEEADTLSDDSPPPSTVHRLPSSPWHGLKVVFALSTAIDVLFQRAFGGDEEVVVIDTMRNLLQLSDETDNSRIAAVLNPWIAAARMNDKTLIMAHHMRKGSSEHGEGIAGGHALLGTFDVALEMSRDESNARRRRIRCYARLISPPDIVYEMDEAGHMRYLGNPDALKLDEVESRILVVLGNEWRKTREVRDDLGEPLPSVQQVRVALLQLARRGEIERDPPIHQPGERITAQWRRQTTAANAE